MGDRLLELEVFLRVGETESFLRKALDLGTNQPVESRMVASLDKRLDVSRIAPSMRCAPCDPRAIGAKATLLAWLIVSGPGFFSCDPLLGRGLSWSPLGLLRIMRRLYGWIERGVGPLMPFAVRIGLAVSIMHVAMPASSWVAHAM